MWGGEREWNKSCMHFFVFLWRDEGKMAGEERKKRGT